MKKRKEKKISKRQTQFATSFHPLRWCYVIWWYLGWNFECFIKENIFSRLLNGMFFFFTFIKLTCIKWVGKYVISHLGSDVLFLQLIFFSELMIINKHIANEKTESWDEERVFGFRRKYWSDVTAFEDHP